MTTQAAALYVAHYPGGDWSKVPESIKRFYIRAAEERANPTRCINCGMPAGGWPVVISTTTNTREDRS